MDKVSLSPEQERIIKAVQTGQNLLVTGSAGTGKSTILNHLKDLWPKLPVTASTGIAAVNVEGMTINSWAGLGMAQESPEQILANIMETRGKVYRRIKTADRIAIDEISMIHGKLLDLIDFVFRGVKEDERPFGGIQLVMFGDFLQLPPVAKDREEQLFAFQSKAWKEADVRTAMLTKVFRQQDQEFADALNKIRVGQITPDVAKLLVSRLRPHDRDPEIEPVTVYTHNADVDRLNNNRLAELAGETKEFKSNDYGDFGPLETLRKNCLAPELLNLKVGAQVMLLWNIEPFSGLANGSIGTVAGWSPARFPVVKFRNGRKKEIEPKTWEIKSGGDIIAARTQVPLRLAWAITAHKSQGMTLDKIKVHLDKAFEYGQSYVALSRSRTKEGLFIESSKKGCIKAHPAAVKFYEECAKI